MSLRMPMRRKRKPERRFQLILSKLLVLKLQAGHPNGGVHVRVVPVGDEVTSKDSLMARATGLMRKPQQLALHMYLDNPWLPNGHAHG